MRRESEVGGVVVSCFLVYVSTETSDGGAQKGKRGGSIGVRSKQTNHTGKQKRNADARRRGRALSHTLTHTHARSVAARERERKRPRPHVSAARAAPPAADDAAALAGALPLASLADVLDGVVAASQAGLEALADDVAGRADDER